MSLFTYHVDVIRALNHQLDAKWREFGTFLYVNPAVMYRIKKDQSEVSVCCSCAYVPCEACSCCSYMHNSWQYLTCPLQFHNTTLKRPHLFAVFRSVCHHSCQGDEVSRSEIRNIVSNMGNLLIL